MKRFFDIVVSFFGLLFLSPLFLFLAICIVLESKGDVFYFQERIGKNFVPFKLYKFRSMRPDSDKKGLLTVGMRDNRITKTGYYIRKYKLDELPQLINVLLGDMSIVGPRPEVKKYVDMYDATQRSVLNVQPGITDWASLEYYKENELLSQSTDPEKTYIEEIMPAKLLINQKYIANHSMTEDIKIIWMTARKVWGE
jgi:lipopolysaccharide/colanic/teichoic acid biosynthesis glycosyltransferase